MNSAVFMCFVLPFLLGMLTRLLFLKWQKGYVISGVFVLISVIVWIWTKNLVNHGVDGTVLLWAVMTTEFTVGLLLVGGISFLLKKMKH